METSRILLRAFCLTAFAGSSLWADDVPQRLAFDRYSGMLTRSPFAVATEVLPQAAPNFAKDLYVANAAHTGDGDFVTLNSAVDRAFKEYLSTREANSHGYKIISIDWSDRPGETKVNLSKDGQVATLSFNQALMSQVPPQQQPAAAQPSMMQPNAPAGNLPGGYAPPKPAVPMIPPPAPAVTPHTRGIIPRSPSASNSNVRPPVRNALIDRE